MHSERFELKTIFSYDLFLVKHREQITLQMWEMGKSLHCSYISFSVLFQTISSLVWKRYTQKLCTIFQTIPVWFGKITTDFARRRFQTKFRLVWKILMTIVNVLKIPNQIQFGLEKSLAEYHGYDHNSV